MYEGIDFLHGSRGGETILRGIEAVVDELIDSRRSYMEPGVCGGVVDKHLAVALYPAVGEGYVHHIADVLVAFGHKEPSTWSGNDTCGVIQGGHIHIEHIAQPARRCAYTMREVKPPLGRLDGRRSFAVLDLIDGLIVTGLDYAFVARLGTRDIFGEGPTDAATFSGFDETILGTGVEGILPVHKLRMEDDVTLLAEGG